MKTPPLIAVLGGLLLAGCSTFDTMQQWAATGIPGPGGPAYAGEEEHDDDDDEDYEEESSPHPSSPWAGAPQVTRKSSGRKSQSYNLPDGNVSESPSGNRTYRSRQTGSVTGSEWTSPAGTTTYRDSSGQITGSSTESPSGTRTYRDNSGSIAMQSSTTEGTGGDNTTTYRRNGTIVGTKYVSPAGNVTWRDGSGTIIDGPSEMKP